MGAVSLIALAAVGGFVMLRNAGPPSPPAPEEIAGSPAWARKHYGDPDAPAFKARRITSIDFLGRTMSIHAENQLEVSLPTDPSADHGRSIAEILHREPSRPLEP